MYDVHARARGGGGDSKQFISPLVLSIYVYEYVFLPPDFRETGGRWGGGICMNKPRQN